jgi:two-component system, chemotaxis family, protein-glutamate methylesterase/glutaminase
VVYGMPRVAWENGFIHRQVSLEKMAETINTLAREMR